MLIKKCPIHGSFAGHRCAKCQSIVMRDLYERRSKANYCNVRPDEDAPKFTYHINWLCKPLTNNLSWQNI